MSNALFLKGYKPVFFNYTVSSSRDRMSGVLYTMPNSAGLYPMFLETKSL